MIVVLVIAADNQMNLIREPIRGILFPSNEALLVDRIQLYCGKQPGKTIDLRDSRFLIEEDKLAEFLPAIKKMLKEERYLTGMHSSPSREIRITKRESEVLQCIALEMTNENIARKLFISKRTVDSHRQNLMEKLNTHNTVGLVKIAYAMGLIK